MICYGKASVSEFLEDFIVYRNLVPMDKRLPSMADICKKLGLSLENIPRKTTKEYARIMTVLLSEARSITLPGASIERVIFIGDTRMNDGTAFSNICQAGSWKGMAFIGSEKKESEKWVVEDLENELIFSSNRWTALSKFEDETRKRSFSIDKHTAILIDLDKTALGARGRNDKVIDRARVQAAKIVAENLLGNDFNIDKFQGMYNELNQPEFHPFTADNQDYLVYVCLILASGLYNFDTFLQNVRDGNLQTFRSFIADVDHQLVQLSPNLRSAHQDFFNNWQKGDPTPFKAFRFCEYQNTADTMGISADNEDIGYLLETEIVITQEVRKFALKSKEQDALLFGLSDKPDEASIPTHDLEVKGYKPIHQITTHIVGE